jgi:hypothetical protein
MRAVFLHEKLIFDYYNVFVGVVGSSAVPEHYKLIIKKYENN